MDQLKIGKFIAERRKELNITQEVLAKKLGITDRAVSKWERGINLPDASLMLDLCSILGINVNELLTGRVIESEEYMKKAEENLINVSMENQKMKKQTIIKNATAVINLVLLIILWGFVFEDFIISLYAKPIIFIASAVVVIIMYIVLLWKNFKLKEALLWLTLIIDICFVGFVLIFLVYVPFSTKMGIYNQLQETTINAMKYIAVNNLETQEEIVFDFHDFTTYENDLESCRGYILYNYNNGKPEIEPYCNCDLNWFSKKTKKEFYKMLNYDESYLNKIQRVQRE